MKRLALVLLLVACGGGSKSGSTTPTTGAEPVARATAPDCKAAADHMAAGDAQLATALEARCESDQWSEDTRSCLAEKSEDACTLTDAQKAGVADARAQATTAEPAAAPPPPSEQEEPPVKTRGAVKKHKDRSDGKTADPCEGGE